MYRRGGNNNDDNLIDITQVSTHASGILMIKRINVIYDQLLIEIHIGRHGM